LEAALYGTAFCVYSFINKPFKINIAMIGKIVGWGRGEAMGGVIVGSNVPNLNFDQ
jgi:hypothetical protein